jgi:hypothetical protein
MKILSQQPWITVVDFLVRFPDSPDEAKALGRIVYLLRDSIIEHRWITNMHRIYDLMKEQDWHYMWADMPMATLKQLDEMVYGDA